MMSKYNILQHLCVPLGDVSPADMLQGWLESWVPQPVLYIPISPVEYCPLSRQTKDKPSPILAQWGHLGPLFASSKSATTLHIHTYIHTPTPHTLFHLDLSWLPDVPLWVSSSDGMAHIPPPPPSPWQCSTPPVLHLSQVLAFHCGWNELRRALGDAVICLDWSHRPALK